MMPTEAIYRRGRERAMAVDAGGPCDLVCEGGGIKGIGLVGALSVLEARGYTVERRAGTSAGAIVAALHAAGYSARELRNILLDFDFMRFLDEGWEDQIPLAGPAIGILAEKGVCEGVRFEEWMRTMLAEKGVHTFADLRRKPSPEEAGDPLSEYSLQVVVSDTTTHELLLLPRDALKLGIKPDDFEVAVAVRASMSVPIVFEPKVIASADGVTHVLVDGGLLSNFPVWVFDRNQPRWPTFGLMLVEGDAHAPVSPGVTPAENLGLRSIPAIDFVIALVQTMLQAHDRLYLQQADFVRTIPIETLGIGTIEFDLSSARKEALFVSGVQAAEKFLPFDFASYVATFRSQTEPPHRTELARALMADAAPVPGSAAADPVPEPQPAA
jgi:NTE family protein